MTVSYETTGRFHCNQPAEGVSDQKTNIVVSALRADLRKSGVGENFNTGAKFDYLPPAGILDHDEADVVFELGAESRHHRRIPPCRCH